MIRNTKYTYIKLSLIQPSRITIVKRSMWHSLFKAVRERAVQNAARKAIVAKAREIAPVPLKSDAKSPPISPIFPQESVNQKNSNVNVIPKEIFLPAPLSYSPINYTQLMSSNKPVTTTVNSLQKDALDKLHHLSLDKHTVEKTSIVSNLSGLMDLQAEWINANNEIPLGVKEFLTVMYIKILHTFAIHDINTYQKLLMHFDKFFQTCQDIFEEFPDNILFRHRYMSTLQHILISFLQDQEIPINLFEAMTGNRINYDMYPTGNALLAIESYVIDTITKESSFSFVMINPEVPTLKKLPFTIQQSQLLTGQPNCDSLGISASTDADFKMTYLYSDVKMHSCSSLKGQFTLKPDLCHSKRAFCEYIISYDTGLGEWIKRRKEDISVSYKDTLGIERQYIKEKLSADHPINEFFNKVKAKREEMLQIIKKFPCDKTYYKFFRNKEDIQKVKQLLKEFNAILLEGMTVKNISKEVNLGLSVDPGQANLFKEIYHDLLKFSLSLEITRDKCSKIDFRILVSSTFDKYKHREAVHAIIELFPEEVIRFAKKGINLIDNLS